MRIGWVFVSMLMTATVAAQPATPDPSIVKVADAYVKATIAGDAKAVAALYTEDAVELPPNQPILKGRAAIEQYYTKLFGDGSKLSPFTLAHIETTSSGNIGYDVGTYKQTITMKDGKAVNDSGKYVVLVKKSGANWKVAYAIYNSDQPPMPTPPVGR